MTHIERQLIERLVEVEDVSKVSAEDLRRLVRQERAIQGMRPDGIYQMDPRSGDAVLFVTSRHKRPHDTLPVPGDNPGTAVNCPICRGQTTGIVDVASLSKGSTFINKNLYPVFYPFTGKKKKELSFHAGQGPDPAAQLVDGLHFVQWTSSEHDVDWHNLPVKDGVVVMSRLAALERTLLDPEQGDSERYVVIIKNYGHLVGSSLEHGHQQIALSSVMPRRFRDNLRFAEQHGETLSSYMLRVNPAELLVRDYGPVQLLVPYFMRRPYDMMLIVKDVSKRFLYELSWEELTAVAAGWGDAITAIRALMPKRGREPAYNVISSSGPGSGFMFEFLPYTQETGSLEHLGLITSEASPAAAAEELRGSM